MSDQEMIKHCPVGGKIILVNFQGEHLLVVVNPVNHPSDKTDVLQTTYVAVQVLLPKNVQQTELLMVPVPSPNLNTAIMVL